MLYFDIGEQSLSMTGRGAEEIWMGYQIFLRILLGYEIFKKIFGWGVKLFLNTKQWEK